MCLKKRHRTLTFLLQVKHLFRFFCSGRTGASASAAIAAAVATAAPSASAPPPIAGGVAPPTLNDSGLGDGATDNEEGEDEAEAATGVAVAAGAEIGAGGCGGSTDAVATSAVAAAAAAAAVAGVATAGGVAGAAAPVAGSEGAAPPCATDAGGAGAGAVLSLSSIAEGLLKVIGGKEDDATAIIRDNIKVFRTSQRRFFWRRGETRRRAGVGGGRGQEKASRIRGIYVCRLRGGF